MEERLELLESTSLAPVSPHVEERLELLESLFSKEQAEQYSRFTKRSAEPYPEQVRVFSLASNAENNNRREPEL